MRPRPCVKFLMRVDPLRGEVGGGWALEIETFLDPATWHRADRQVPFGAQKTRLSNVTALLSPITKLIINQEEIVRYIKERSGT
jgi:hypothetical protein